MVKSRRRWIGSNWHQLGEDTCHFLWRHPKERSWEPETERKRQGGKTGRSVLEKKLKKEQDWVDDSHAISDSDNDGEEMEETFDYEYDPDDYF